MNFRTLSFLLVFLISNSITAKSYYVNAESGSDKNDGKSKDSAWKNLWKVNQKIYKPGDKILFAAGTSYEGKLGFCRI
tara:strand:+ start:344 stop:577 length:234 start_codon:yes stop_codon:yes gene_type:complete